jgi:hypothetical protein
MLGKGFQKETNHAAGVKRISFLEPAAYGFRLFLKPTRVQA